MQFPIKTFDPNESGRDFVIGDLHGSLSCLDRLLKGIGFDYTKDRMFSVADLMDRGPDSLGCMRLMRENWFECVLANHEQLMYEAFHGGYSGSMWFPNGGTWGMEAHNVFRNQEGKRQGRAVENILASEEDLEIIDLLELVAELPFLITINHKNGKKFHIIHAELPPNARITDDDLTHPEKVLELATRQTDDGDMFLWGRYKFGYFHKADLGNRAKILRTVNNNRMADDFNPNLSHIISGHTIMQQPFTLIGQTNIDTGAYHSYPHRDHSGYEKVPKWAGLTCVCLDDWKFYKATPVEFKETTPFVINRDDVI